MDARRTGTRGMNPCCFDVGDLYATTLFLSVVPLQPLLMLFSRGSAAEGFCSCCRKTFLRFGGRHFPYHQRLHPPLSFPPIRALPPVESAVQGRIIVLNFCHNAMEGTARRNDREILGPSGRAHSAIFKCAPKIGAETMSIFAVLVFPSMIHRGSAQSSKSAFGIDSDRSDCERFRRSMIMKQCSWNNSSGRYGG